MTNRIHCIIAVFIAYATWSTCLFWNHSVSTVNFFDLPEQCTPVFDRDHDWFQKDLPNYLFPSPQDQDASIVEMDVIREICEVHVNPLLLYKMHCVLW